MLRMKIFLGLIVASLLLVSCEIKNPTEGLEVRLQTISRTTGVNVEIIDGATGNPIVKPQTVSVSFIGDNKDKIITSSNEPITELTTQAGIAVFALEDGLIPTLSNPVYLNLSIASDGYNSVTKKIKIEKAGISNYIAVLTSIQNPTSGVATGTDTGGQSGSDGTVTDTIAVTSDNSNNSDGEATVAVPAGTQLKDNSGNNLSGTVTTTIVYTDASNAEGASTLPGGGDSGASKDGVDQGGFAPACGIDIQMKVNGKPVENISGKEIEVAFSLPQNSVNPNTGQVYQTGETLGIYKYNSESGVWEWIKDLILGETAGDGLAAKYLFKKNPFVLGGVTTVPGVGHYCFGDPFTEVTRTLKMVSTTGSSGTVYVMSGSKYSSIYMGLAKATEHGDEFEVTDIAFASPTILVFSDRLSGQILGELDINSSWGDASSPIEITFTPEGISVPITVSVKCDSQADNPRVISPDGFPLWAMRVNSSGSEELSGWQSIGSFSNGTLTANLLENEYYKFKTEYDGEFYNSLDYESPFKATSSGISYSIVDDNRVCDNF